MYFETCKTMNGSAERVLRGQLDRIAMNASKRLKAHEDLRYAEILVGALLVALSRISAVAATLKRGKDMLTHR